MRNVDSRIHSRRFDCCAFLFYSFSAVTFATIGAKRTCRERLPMPMTRRSPVLARSDLLDPLHNGFDPTKPLKLRMRKKP
jgi:hypothetical protein